MNPEMFGDGTLDKSAYAKRKVREALNETRSKRTPKRSPLKEVPDERRGFWHGVMCTKLRAQEEEDWFGGFYCCQCGDPNCQSQIEGFDEARRFFLPGHIKPRSATSHKGFRLRYVQTLGPDDPDNIVPVSPSCNASEFWSRQGKPDWSKSA